MVEVMPSEFSAKDASLALGNCPSINGTEGTEQLKVFADTFVVSPAFVQVFVRGNWYTKASY